MANQMFGVTCPECNVRFYLVDTEEGPCESCGAPVAYAAPTVAPAPKKPSRRKDVLEDGSPAAVKYSGK